MIKKNDFLMAGIIGFFTALFILPTLKNAELLGIPYVSYLLIVGLPILWVLALLVGRFLSRWLSWIYQFVKYGVLGFFNTAIDFGVLNFLSFYSGLTSGFIIGGVNVPGFVLAATNSYFWNKFWVFSHKRAPGEKTDYSDVFIFIIVLLSSALVNSGLVILLSTYVHPMFGFSETRWLNMAKVVATAFSFFWNFLGFKFFVFKGVDSRNQSR